MEKRKIHIVVVTGLSGSGKSTAIKAFEDLGYFCIDNLPLPLLRQFLTLCEQDMADIEKIALGIDIRERKFLHDADRVFQSLEDEGYLLEIIFLEASNDVMQRRYSQTRRLHPVGLADTHLLDSIRYEREKLSDLRRRATRIVDTSSYSVHQLKGLITRFYALVGEHEMLSVQMLSFGYKYGTPLEADLLMDVRFLPNPYFVDELRPQDGTSPAVRDWVLQWDASREFIEDYGSLLLKLFPMYIAEGKRYLTVGIGCTGGKHRSVVISNQLAERLRREGYYVVLFHRDVHLE